MLNFINKNAVLLLFVRNLTYARFNENFKVNKILESQASDSLGAEDQLREKSMNW